MESMLHSQSNLISQVKERLALGVADPRGWIAWRINNAANGLIRLAGRVIPEGDMPFGTYEDGWVDGAEYEHRHPRQATRQDIVEAFEHLGIRVTDENMAVCGFGAEAATA